MPLMLPLPLVFKQVEGGEVIFYRWVCGELGDEEVAAVLGVAKSRLILLRRYLQSRGVTCETVLNIYPSVKDKIVGELDARRGREEREDRTRPVPEKSADSVAETPEDLNDVQKIKELALIQGYDDFEAFLLDAIKELRVVQKMALGDGDVRNYTAVSAQIKNYLELYHKVQLSRDEVDREIEAIVQMKQLTAEVEAMAEFLRREEKRSPGIMQRYRKFLEEWKNHAESD